VIFPITSPITSVSASSAPLSFIKDGRLQASPTVGTLVQYLEPAQVEDRCQLVFRRFLADTMLYAIPVVDAQRKPVAVLDRNYFVEFFSREYATEVFGRRSLAALFLSGKYDYRKPVVIDHACNIDEAAKIISEAGTSHMSGFMVVEDERYRGIANGHDLLGVITERRQSELYYLAHYDVLTGIPNRTLLTERLVQACADAAAKYRLVVLLFIDIDRFKQINDSLGHAAGDEVLHRVAQRLRKSSREADMVARLGGDEFVILLENIPNVATADAVASRVLSAMREPIVIGECSLVVTVSVGRAIFPTDDRDSSALLAKADSAMYEAKASGRNNYRGYLPGTASYKPSSMHLENELRQAIESDQLVLFLQPQVELERKIVLGAEALIRWQHPVRGLLRPVEFIPLAEECGLIIPLGEWVLRKVLELLSLWRGQGIPLLQIAVNISALQLYSSSFPDQLRSLLAQYDMDPRYIELELTESVLMKDVCNLLPTLNAIKALGIRLAIDDFGTGFSSLSYLSSFPIDCLKIDKSFVRHIDRMPINASIARAILALANSLSLTTIAEGIEAGEEDKVLRQLGCMYGQGYHFAKPLPADDFPIWCMTWNSQPE
jgi:diguanylate cyclase